VCLCVCVCVCVCVWVCVCVCVCVYEPHSQRREARMFETATCGQGGYKRRNVRNMVPSSAMLSVVIGIVQMLCLGAMTMVFCDVHLQNCVSPG
jgi:hypothetical protein